MKGKESLNAELMTNGTWEYGNMGTWDMSINIFIFLTAIFMFQLRTKASTSN